MTPKPRTPIGIAVLVALLASGCGPLGVASSVAGTAIAGTFYVRSQTVERTFVASSPDVHEACRRAIREMGFTITRDEGREDEHVIIATAYDAYVVEVTMRAITPKAVHVAINADTLPERDKATAQEIINQMSATLSPRPDGQLLASPAVERERAAPPHDRIQTVSLSSPPLMAAQPVPPVNIRPPATPTHEIPGEQYPPVPISATSRPMVTPSIATAMPIGSQSPPSTHADAPAAPAEIRGDPQQLYEAAIQAYIQGDFSTAVTHFRTYLATPPTGEDRSRSLYWLGEALYSQGEYADALLQFEIVRRDYPLSPEVPRALLKGAHAYRQLHNGREARARLQTLIRQYPESREARAARALLPQW